ncbi:MAG: Gfo/Idh/MocA family oxidoreductase [Planctomycetota bacterium]
MAISGEVRIGVIGLGRRGFQLRFVHDVEKGVRVVAGADPLPEAREKFLGWMKTWNKAAADVASDYRELLARADINAIFITSCDYLHEEHAIAALRAGKAVYLDKPMAITLAGCDRILEAAAASGALLFVGHNMRYAPVILQMKKLIDSGAIGEPKAAWCRHFVGYGGDAYFKDWHSERAKTTGLLLQKGVHDIDVLHWLAGGASRRVVGMGGLTLYDKITDRRSPETRPDCSWNDAHWPPLSQTGLSPVIDVEDVSQVLMQLETGGFASYQQCHYAPDQWRNYTVIGTEGRVENLGDSPGEAEVCLWDRRVGYLPRGQKQFPIPQSEGGHGGADPSIVAEFIRCLRGGAKPRTSPVAARDAVGAAYQATMSLREGCVPKDVPPVPPELAAKF